jgi:(5-formylfuran-3-yl)methyl phosphate synthase
MQLLVSVRTDAEVAAALWGGADIIDAKEPGRGSLGAVSAEVLGAILERVPSHRTVSVALGDFTRPDDIRSAIGSLVIESREAATYVKLGFAGLSGGGSITALLEAAVAAALSHEASPRIVAVAYADARLAGTAPPDIICRAAALSGAAGVLFDTHAKGSGNLLTWVEPETLAALVAGCRQKGLLTAVAGGLQVEHLGLVASTRPDIVGFRGAACTGGRAGRVSRRRVQQLRRAMRNANSGFIQDLVPNR